MSFSNLFGSWDNDPDGPAPIDVPLVPTFLRNKRADENTKHIAVVGAADDAADDEVVDVQECKTDEEYVDEDDDAGKLAATDKAEQSTDISEASCVEDLQPANIMPEKSGGIEDEEEHKEFRNAPVDFNHPYAILNPKYRRTIFGDKKLLLEKKKKEFALKQREVFALLGVESTGDSKSIEFSRDIENFWSNYNVDKFKPSEVSERVMYLSLMWFAFLNPEPVMC